MISQTWFYVAVIPVAGLAIAVGVILPAIGQARAATAAMEAIARQPDEAGTITRNLFISLAMIESLALYVLIVALILLFADPLQDHLSEAASKGKPEFWFLAGSAIVSGATIGIGTMFSALGQGRVSAAAMAAIAEQPGARDSVSTTMYIALALLESLALYALIVALILLFANPLMSKVFP